MREFGKRLDELREARGLTVAEVAHALKINKQMYIRIEKGLSSPRVSRLIKIIRFYEVSADYLLEL